MSNGPLHKSQAPHNAWEPFKGLLKEKISPKPNDASSATAPDTYWNRFQEITGKTKEEIQSALGRF